MSLSLSFEYGSAKVLVRVVLLLAMAALGEAQSAILSTQSLNYSIQRVGTSSAPQSVNVTNTGSATLLFNGISVVGVNRSDWAPLSNNCTNKMLPVGKSCAVTAIFTPGGEGARTASIQLTDNASNSPQTVSLTGTGGAPVVSLSPASLNFGIQTVGSGASQVVTLTNVGNEPLTVSSVSTSGDYTQANTCGGPIAPLASCKITATFTPSGTWARMGSMTIQDTAGTQPVPLSGMGSSGGSPSLSASSLTFPVTTVGSSSAAQVVTLSNNGSGPITIQNIVSSGDFTQSNNCGSVLNASAACNIQITFTPGWKATRKGEVALTYLDPPMVQSIAVLGGTKALASTVTLLPRQYAVLASQTVQFQALVNGVASSNVTWAVDGVGGGNSSVGTIASGLYTAPTSPGSHTVTAVSVANSTQSASAPVAVTAYAGMFTYHNDPARTGQNVNENALTTVNVNPAQFGKLFSYPLDGYVYAQPLYVPNLNIPNQGMHNVVYVATEHNSVYALDADNPGGSALWQTSFINPSSFVTPVPAGDVMGGNDLIPEFGITGTPVIDPANSTLYVVAATKEPVSPNNKIYQYVQRLHALDITTGLERSNSPVVIQTSVPGTGAGHNVQNQIPFNSLLENQRPGLALVNGVIYMAWGSHNDQNPFHGWVIGCDENSLQIVTAFNTTPNSSEGGIWQGGAAPAVDGDGNIYVATSNGTFNAHIGGADYGDAFLRLNTSGGLSVTDYFSPFNQTVLSAQNLDLGSAGPIVLPDQPGPFPHVMVGGGKTATLYLLNRDNLGGFNASGDQVLQELTGVLNPTGLEVGLRGAPAYWANRVYVSSAKDKAKVFPLFNGLLSTVPFSQTALSFYYPGVTPSISSNRLVQGIVWMLDNGGYSQSFPAVLHAYDAHNLGFELYNTKMNATRDQLGAAVKFSVPTVANGKVYVAGQFELNVYGLLP
jgi:hypothetical protein